MFPSKHSLVRYEIVIHHRAFVNRFLSKYSLVKKIKLFYTSQSIRLHNTWLRSRELTTARLTRPCPARFDTYKCTRAWPGRTQADIVRPWWLQLDGYPGTTTSGPLSTKEADPRLAKRPLVRNGRLANRGSTPLAKETAGANQLIKVTNNYQCMPSYSACHHTITLNCYTIRSLDAVTPRLSN